MLPGFGNSGGTGKVTITTGSNSNGNGLNDLIAPLVRSILARRCAFRQFDDTLCRR